MKIRNLTFFLGSFLVMSLSYSCTSGGGENAVGAGTYCYKFEQSIASSIVSLEINADGTVTGQKQNLLTDKNGNKETINHALVTGTISADTLYVELTKDIRGDVQVLAETWIISDSLLATSKLGLTPSDCSELNWVDIPTSFNIQGKWKNDNKADDFLDFTQNVYTQISQERIGGEYNASFDIMDTCGIRLNSLGKYIMLQNGLCIEINELSEDKMTLTNPGLGPATYSRVK